MAERPHRVGPGDRRRALLLGESRVVPGGSFLRFAVLLLAWLVACAPPPPEAVPDPDAARVAEREAIEILDRAESIHEGGGHARAARMADSLRRAWRAEPGLEPLANQALWLHARALDADGSTAAAARGYEELVRRLRDGPVRVEAIRRLALLRHGQGEAEGAVRLLLDHPEALNEDHLSLVRELAPALTERELERLVGRYPAERAAAAPLHSDWATRLVVAGRRAEADRVVRRLLASEPAAEERRVAETLAAALEGRSLPVRIGAILPLSGPFAQVGELLREGIELAVEEFGAEPGRRAAIELLIEDDGSDPERAAELVRDLEARGALALIGPVRSESFSAAAAARHDPRLPLLSPTATEVPTAAPHAYTLWSRERRERDVARDLAEWSVGRLGLRLAAILYPAGEGGRWVAESFAEAIREAGGEVVHAVPYLPEATTFEEPISAVAEAEPEVVFVVAESVPAVLQLAPQLPYYGVSTAVVAGGAIWSDPAVVRRLEGGAADFRVVGTFVDRLSEDTPWDQFRAAYEETFNKPLRDNMLPALAYDATRLVLAAVGDVGWLPLPALVSDALARAPERTGATGWLRPDPGSSTVQRRTLLRMILDRELVEADPLRILEWLEEARIRAEEEKAAAGEERQ